MMVFFGWGFSVTVRVLKVMLFESTICMNHGKTIRKDIENADNCWDLVALNYIKMNVSRFQITDEWSDSWWSLSRRALRRGLAPKIPHSYLSSVLIIPLRRSFWRRRSHVHALIAVHRKPREASSPWRSIGRFIVLKFDSFIKGPLFFFPTVK